MQDVVLDHHRGDDDEDDDQGIEHGGRTHLLEIVLAEHRQVNRETRDEDEHQQDLSHDGQTDSVVTLFTTLHLLLKRLEDIVGLGIYNVTSIHNLLSTLNQSAGQGDTVVQVV